MSINVMRMGSNGKIAINAYNTAALWDEEKNIAALLKSAIMFLVIKSNKRSFHKIQDIRRIENKNHS